MTDAHLNPFSALAALVGGAIVGFYSHLAPWLLLAAVLVVVDLRFGVLASKKRGETIRSSRMWRRTLNKMVDYLCWVTLAEVCSRTFGITIGSPVVSMGMLFIIYGIELSSCVNNYLEFKGINKKFNIWRLMGRESLLEDKDKNKE